MLARQQIRLRRQQRPVLDQISEVVRETTHGPTSFRADRHPAIPNIIDQLLASGRKIVTKPP
jgi:hypothetical protein